ncbi:uncharacterized protein LOC131672208 [Phymastichus coffea]|uniref:uncharacterized protein LOC131672208 n=1 Tax=Phymastichus coffea TaxID=108790 RepID=UPI00273C97EF|nr:uncharacterized protein LOC131672208 [Phymastichus coffea]
MPISDYEACWKCNETGHNPINCKNDQISKQNKCENCDKIGHTMQQCPEVICRKCNNMGHLVKDCKAGEIKKSLYKTCAICEEVGHEQDTCDQVKIMFIEFKAKQKFKCQYCEDTGHTAKYCPLLKTQPQQVQQTQQLSYNSNHNGFQRKGWAYCKSPGHNINDCIKLSALMNNTPTNQQKICEFCKKHGHVIDECSIILSRQKQAGEFCGKCKIAGHATQNCFRNKGRAGNFEALSGGNA